MKYVYVLIAACVLLLATLVGGFYFYPCVTFVPLRLERGEPNKLVPAPELINTEYFESIQIVLHYYDEKFRIDSNKNLLITWHLSLNKELLWNYSTKAANTNLVKSMKGKRLYD